MLKNRIHYYRACYQADFRAINLVNFFGSKVEQDIILEEAALLEGNLMQVPVSTEWAEKVEKRLAVYSKEKALYACSFFITGKKKVAGKTIQILAPLYIHTVQLFQEDEVYYLSLDADNPIINPAFLTGVAQVEPGVIDYLSKNLPTGYLGFDEMDQIEKLLEEVVPEIDISALAQYPDVYNQKAIKQTLKEDLKILPAVGIGIIDKPRSSRGILNELEAIAQGQAFSPPLNAILGVKNRAKARKAPSYFTVPIILSKPQQNILSSAFKYDLSLAIGPPGSGKSFTIAALAVEFLSQGKSVLIASKNNQAVNVVADKIEGFGLGEVVVRAGRDDYRKLLRGRIDNLLSGIGVKDINFIDLTKLRNAAKQSSKEIQIEEKVVAKRVKKELKRGQLLYGEAEGFWDQLQRKWISFQKAQAKPFWKLMFELEEILHRRNETGKKFLDESFHYYLRNALNYSRKDMRTLSKALRARTGNKKDSLFSGIDFVRILDALPIWVTNTADINKVLPLQANLFDLVILDEATQCDIASSLPVLQRGKKAVIVGDPKQLRHLSFLSRKQQQLLIQKYDLGTSDNDVLDYRSNSILDLVSASIKRQDQVHFLDEHYRSMPDIIAFSNKEFYGNNLHVMTACPATLKRKHLFLNQMEGKRRPSGYNKEEADAILKQVIGIIKKEEKLATQFCQSIGVISPFRDQVNYIIRQVEKQFTAEDIERHRLLIGTPYTFQGEECDLIFISFALDDQSHPSAFRYLDRPDVFNVAITRARSEQQVFISFDPSSLKNDTLLAKYLYSIQKEVPVIVDRENYKSDLFLKEVLKALEAIELDELYTAYPIAGTEIDIVIVKDDRTLCIDLVGYPGAFEEALPIERWRMLERVGIRTFTMDYSSWVLDQDACLNALHDFVG